MQKIKIDIYRSKDITLSVTQTDISTIHTLHTLCEDKKISKWEAVECSQKHKLKHIETLTIEIP
jgi:hypothetical protein